MCRSFRDFQTLSPLPFWVNFWLKPRCPYLIMYFINSPDGYQDVEYSESETHWILGNTESTFEKSFSLDIGVIIWLQKVENYSCVNVCMYVHIYYSVIFLNISIIITSLLLVPVTWRHYTTQNYLDFKTRFSLELVDFFIDLIKKAFIRIVNILQWLIWWIFL